MSKKYTDDLADVEVMRNGKTMRAQLQLSEYNRLIPEHLSNRPPSYLIISGFVFTQVGEASLLCSLGPKDCFWQVFALGAMAGYISVLRRGGGAYSI